MIEHKSLEFGQANETVFISLGYMYIWTMDISLGGSVVELQGSQFDSHIFHCIYMLSPPFLLVQNFYRLQAINFIYISILYF